MCRGQLRTPSTLQTTNRRQSHLETPTTTTHLLVVFLGPVHVTTSLEYDVIYLLTTGHVVTVLQSQLIWIGRW